jgi:hypothetical protein
MTRDTQQPGEFELFVLETLRAEQAGVLEGTPVDAEKLVAQRGSTDPLAWWSKKVTMLAPLAACIALSFVVARVWLTSPMSDVPMNGSQDAVQVSPASYCYDLATFEDCFTGPGANGLSGECACADFDQDGDVDFADFGAFQRAAPELSG